ncbi:MAG: endonuclease/exonuclease/phosphatase family protein, partial [Candidatus Thiodiazotropha taylori]|nr:endonuclease/exonuclease/phosphatase family protein [Candidatus Thiodiazotropha taylori]MCW4334714.1 endonuclease/exonuclease/phosphatase family protein [Candidatus Thiodiazotropha endolucinida]
MSLKIASLNVFGFRSQFKQDLIKEFVTKNKIDILLLQETYVDNVTLARSIEQKFNLNRRCIWNFGKSDSCGVAIFLINEKLVVENFDTDIYGRLIRLDFSGEEISNFRILNIYFPNNSTERLDFIQSLSRHLCGAKNLILGGDFNFIMDSNLDKIGGNLDKGMVGSKSFKSLIDKMSLVDCFRHLFPKKRAVTWMRKNQHNYDMIATRLDRFYISSVMKNNLSSFDTIPCSCSDHDFIMMQLNCQNGAGTSFGKSYWKFNDELLEDKSFVSAFKIFWEITSKTETVDLNWWDKMKHNIKLFCIDYSKSKNRDLYGELKLLKQKYNRLDLKQTSDLKLLDEIKTRVKEIETSLSRGSLIRSKARNLETNENPSSYFFQKEASASKSKTVKSITHNNVSYSSSSDILTCFKSFYESLYSEEPVDPSLNSLFLDNLPQVEPSDNNFLKNKINKSEILSALKDMKPHKSPGSDGLSSSFYVTFFDILGDTLSKIINLAYEKGELSDSQKLSYITLICKDDTRADEMKCYRPISLL